MLGYCCYGGRNEPSFQDCFNLFAVGDIFGTIKLCKEYLKRNGDDFDVRMLLADLLFRTENVKQGIKNYEFILKSKVAPESLKNMVEIMCRLYTVSEPNLYENVEFINEIWTEMRNVVKSDPKMPSLNYYLALFLCRIAKANPLDSKVYLEEALIYFKQAVDFGYGRISMAYYLMGEIYWQFRQTEKACSSFEKATVEIPTLLFAWLGVVKCQISFRKHQNPIGCNAFGVARQLCPDKIPAHIKYDHLKIGKIEDFTGIPYWQAPVPGLFAGVESVLDMPQEIKQLILRQSGWNYYRHLYAPGLSDDEVLQKLANETGGEDSEEVEEELMLLEQKRTQNRLEQHLQMSQAFDDHVRNRMLLLKFGLLGGFLYLTFPFF